MGTCGAVHECNDTIPNRGYLDNTRKRNSSEKQRRAGMCERCQVDIGGAIVALPLTCIMSSAQTITVISRFVDEYKGCRLQFLHVD